MERRRSINLRSDQKGSAKLTRQPFALPGADPDVDVDSDWVLRELDELVRDMEVLLLLRPAGIGCLWRDPTSKRERSAIKQKVDQTCGAREVVERFAIEEDELPSPVAAHELAAT